jgi:glycosyltransferase involved in cell wall biosynthesis
MTAHRLSVVMPTHDRPELLERAARSVLDQGGPEIELVVVDDASGPATGVVTARLADDPRVRLVRNERSLGPGGARNRALAEATGDLVGFCDDDDAWLPGAAATLADAFDEDPELGAATSWHEVVHERTGRRAIYRGPVEYGTDVLLWFNVVALPFGVIHRERLAVPVAFDESLPTCEDWDLWIRCSLERRIRTLPRILYAYHQHGLPRVTKAEDGSVRGERGLVERHGERMSAACRTYHLLTAARLAGGGGGVAEEARRAPSPAAVATAGAVLVAASALSRVAVARRDPGLTFRVLAPAVAGR